MTDNDRFRSGACPIRRRPIPPLAYRDRPGRPRWISSSPASRSLGDPRTGDVGLHDLYELLVIALSTILSGGQGATHKGECAAAKETRVDHTRQVLHLHRRPAG